MSFIVRDNCINYDSKKEQVKEWVSRTDFSRNKIQPFESDRKVGESPFYFNGFLNVFRDDITTFVQAVKKDLRVTDVWLVRYQKGDWHPPHAHSPIGYSGIIIVDNDPDKQMGPTFIKDVCDPLTGSTTYLGGDYGVSPGTIYYARSDMVHFTYPNPIDTPRIILSFDLKPEL